MENISDTAAFTTSFVLDYNQTITHVSHEIEDGAWLFFSDDEFEEFEAVARVVGLNEILELVSTLAEIINMPVGFYATREFKGEQWTISKVD